MSTMGIQIVLVLLFVTLRIHFLLGCFVSTNPLFEVADPTCFVVQDVGCPNKNVTFWLYKNETRETPLELNPIDLNPWQFKPRRPVKILIHGYTGHRDFSPNVPIRSALLDNKDYYIVSMDYGPLARYPCYFSAVRNLPVASKCLAQLINNLVDRNIVENEDIHLIGFSLGGQVAGQTANYVNKPLKRITGQNFEDPWKLSWAISCSFRPDLQLPMGHFKSIFQKSDFVPPCYQFPLQKQQGLDPAKPMFITASSRRKLDATDAQFVDVIHTDVLGRGMLHTMGHVDFYPNIGPYQPGCQEENFNDPGSCNHDRAPKFYAESINSEMGFWGYYCPSWLHYTFGLCFPNDEQALMGYAVNQSARGSFFLTTAAKTPFALGPIRYDKPSNELAHSLSYYNIEDVNDSSFEPQLRLAFVTDDVKRKK